MKILAALTLCICITTAQADLYDDVSAAYERGDYDTLRIFRPSAEQGNAWAQYNLGVMYHTGDEVTPQDYAEAIKWYRLAAKQGYSLALYNLGYMYNKGHGVLQDYAEAHKWYNLAASRAPSAERAHLAIGNRDGVAEQMTPGQIAEAQKLAKEWDKAHPR